MDKSNINLSSVKVNNVDESVHAGSSQNVDTLTNNDTGTNNHIKFTIGNKSFEKTINNVAYAQSTPISSGSYASQTVYTTISNYNLSVDLSNIKCTLGKYYLVYFYIVYYTTSEMDFYNELAFPILHYCNEGTVAPNSSVVESQVSLVFDFRDFWYHGWSEYSNLNGAFLITFKPGDTKSTLSLRPLGTTSGKLSANFGVKIKEIK